MKNNILKYANNLIKSDYNKYNPDLYNDFQKILNNECIYLSNFFCDKDNYDIFLKLAEDLKNYDSGMIQWSKHMKYENPDFSPTFNQIIQKMSDYFDVEIYHTRMNFYKDGSDWKPFHRDSHAYGNKSLREDFTMGASFGATRSLAILHEKTEQDFEFPQYNNDVFAFTSNVNKKFLHGVPKSKNIDIGPRISIIAWGRRKKITERNGNINEVRLEDYNINNDVDYNKSNNNTNEENKETKNNIVLNGEQIYDIVNNFVSKEKEPKKKINKRHRIRKNINRVQR
tara:strand:- start:1208 stop:2059 length:852 start_codon:yes stop_codon:yes gene_type:complete